MGDWATKVPFSRESYEGDGGWNDGRLGQAYDLVDAVRRQILDTESDQFMWDILERIERADREFKA